MRAARELYRRRFIEGRSDAECPQLPSSACFIRMVHRVHHTGSVLSYVNLVMGNNLIFQHDDGAPAHFAQDVRHYLDAGFRQWIGRGSRSVAWPPRSPDLTPLAFFLWGYIKNVGSVRSAV